MKIAAILIIALGVFLIYAWNTGRLQNVLSVLHNPNQQVVSPELLASVSDSSINGLGGGVDAIAGIPNFLQIFGLNVPSTPPIAPTTNDNPFAGIFGIG